MDKDVRTLYKAALKDPEFQKELDELDRGNRNSKPKWFNSDAYKHFYTITYYGWFLGKYGAEKMKLAFP